MSALTSLQVKPPTYLTVTSPPPALPHLLPVPRPSQWHSREKRCSLSLILVSSNLLYLVGLQHFLHIFIDRTISPLWHICSGWKGTLLDSHWLYAFRQLWLRMVQKPMCVTVQVINLLFLGSTFTNSPLVHVFRGYLLVVMWEAVLGFEVKEERSSNLLSTNKQTKLCVSTHTK